MNISIRQEKPADHEAVFQLIEEAFRTLEISDHTEQFLVERLRKSVAFIPELSLVAEAEGKIVGYILLTKLKIENEQTSFDSLGLAPVAVLPEYQRQGIGARLIEAAHQEAKALGYTAVVLVGHEKYYPKFGYQSTQRFGITFPFDVPPENGMVVALTETGLKGVSGVVVYPKEFGL